jgi:SAM-dependent methyltransferase
MARSLGVDVFCGYVKDFAAESRGTFGAIVCFEVIEHVPDPVGMLDEMHALLAPGGFLIVSVPNAGDPYCLKQDWSSSMPPVHINFFNRTSLAAALCRAGFAVRKMRSPPIPTTSVRNLYGTAGLLLRAPWLLGLRLLGRSDGSGLVALARKPQVGIGGGRHSRT